MSRQTPLKELPAAIEHFIFREWDKGVYATELVKKSLFPESLSAHNATDNNPESLVPSTVAPGPLDKGTFHGTALALTETFDRIEQRFASYFDVLNFEPSLPQPVSLGEKQALYTYQSYGSDKYPPHLNLIPPQDHWSKWQIFDDMRLLDTISVVPKIVPQSLLDFFHGKPEDGSMIAQVEATNAQYRKEKKDIFSEPNVGDRKDWYTDAMFAQQQFTGVNPCTITMASSTWIEQFKAAAKAQSNQKMLTMFISAERNSFYIQDHSYLRSAIGVPLEAAIMSEDRTRFACAAVSLFQLHTHEKLHPIAIAVDYKKTMEDSVVLFNNRLLATDDTTSEATDWPWRYAKNCAQVSDWIRHEVTVHLTNTHLIEEAIIVATHLSFEVEHPVFKLLEPHWYKTLSLNAAARQTLVPNVVVPLVGMTGDQAYAYLNDAYNRFDWTGHYIPNDLANRGFPQAELNTPKFHNYTYARNMNLMWPVLQSFVSTMLRIHYESDADVAADKAIADWSITIQSREGANIPSFPVITTLADLIDAVTMAIHLASPQHTAVNYLQDYYQSFVINRPPSLCTPPPATLTQLLAYKESDLVAALPINRPQEWLLASHLPYLLSFRVAQNQNLINYAVSLWRLYQYKTGRGEPEVMKAASELYEALVAVGKEFRKHSDEMDDWTVPYNVMDPSATAISILI